MDNFDIFFPRASKELKKSMVTAAADREDLPDLSHEVNQLVGSVLTFNEELGNYDNDVSQLLSNTLTSYEKDKIAARLIQMPAGSRTGLSDEDLIDMLPSRYNLTLTDADAVRDYITENFINNKDDSNADSNADTPSDTANIQSATSSSD